MSELTLVVDFIHRNLFANDIDVLKTLHETSIPLKMLTNMSHPNSSYVRLPLEVIHIICSHSQNRKFEWDLETCSKHWKQHNKLVYPISPINRKFGEDKGFIWSQNEFDATEQYYLCFYIPKFQKEYMFSSHPLIKCAFSSTWQFSSVKDIKCWTNFKKKRGAVVDMVFGSVKVTSTPFRFS